MAQQNRILGICNPLLDISADVNHAFLEKYGLLANNAILADSKHVPLYADLVDTHNVHYTAGGSGQNTIRAAQWMLGGKEHEGRTAYIGCIGDDTYGNKLREEATSDGVDVCYHVVNTHPTGTCAVLITDKNRSMVANLAAANEYKISHFETPEIQTLVSNTSFFYASGFFLTVSPETLVALGKHIAANPHKIFLMNLSAPFIVNFFSDKFEAVLPHVDYVFGNEDEFGALGEKFSWGTDLTEIALRLAAQPKHNEHRKRTVIVTHGSEKTLVIHDGKVKEYFPVKVPPSSIVDTNGAGDSFAGGFLAAIALGKSVDEAIGAAHYCAAVTIQTSGVVFRGKTATFFS